MLGIVQIKDTVGQTRAHFSAIVSVHSQTSALTQRCISSTELTKTTRSEYGGVGRLEVLIDNKTTIINETVVMDGVENVIIDISMPCRYQNAALDLSFVLLSLFLFFHITALSILLRSFIIIEIVIIHLIITVVFTLRFLIDFNLIFLLLFVRDV